MKDYIPCPFCGNNIERYKNPVPTVDIVIEMEGGIILIKRKNPPYGWALPGGFVDYGERLEDAAVREAKEETSLDIEIISMIGAYSDPARDPRQHTISIVFQAKARGIAKACDDAEDLRESFTAITSLENWPLTMRLILRDYFEKCSSRS